MRKAVTISARAAAGNARSGFCSAAKLLLNDIKRIPRKTRKEKDLYAVTKLEVAASCGALSGPRKRRRRSRR